MPYDCHEAEAFRSARDLCSAIRLPGQDRISDAEHLSVHGTDTLFVAHLIDGFDGPARTQIHRVDLISGETRSMSAAPPGSRSPKWSPEGRRIAFLSDKAARGDFQLYLMDAGGASASAAPALDGSIEYLAWSPAGDRLLLGIAGRGVDLAGAQGSATTGQSGSERPAWAPRVEPEGGGPWRSLWIYSLDDDQVRPVVSAGLNIWEACWCGDDRLAAIASDASEESAWYAAQLYLIDPGSGATRKVSDAGDQIGLPACPASGSHVAVIEAFCSDRMIMAGSLHLLDTGSCQWRRLDTGLVDVTQISWVSDTRMLIAGVRGPATVVGILDLHDLAFVEMWQSTELSSAGFGVTVEPIGDSGRFCMIAEGFATAPEVADIEGGSYRTILSFDAGYRDIVSGFPAARYLTWSAPDGTEIQGWLLRPSDQGGLPVITNIHGGPVAHSRQAWLGRRGATFLALLRDGHAIFLPNARGSSGRGQAFARMVQGDLGGADRLDHLAGIDELIRCGVADGTRLGVIGGSYGGYMSAWLVTQDPRFAAAVAVAPVANHVSQHLLSNIPAFDRIFLADDYTNPIGRYFTRSPVMHAAAARTPTMFICGALDLCTPPTEAAQLHAAWREHDIESVLVTYPLEGHGIRNFPASIDYTARIVSWFGRHMPARGAHG